jgi:uncharacterized protein (DUF433 family)
MWTDFITQNPEILNGKPVIKNTRIGIDLILEKIGAGETIEDLLTAYPFLSKDAILACISYGAASIRNEIYIELDELS